MLKTFWMNKIKIIRMLSNHSKAHKRKQKKKRKTNKKTHKMSILIPNILMITLNIKGLNTKNKRQKKWQTRLKTHPIISCL